MPRPQTRRPKPKIQPLDPYTLERMLDMKAKGWPVKSCDECGTPRQARWRFCSEECKRRYYRAERETRPLRTFACKWCGETVSTRNRRQVACSPEEAENECFRARDAATYVKEDSLSNPCQGPDCSNEVGGDERGRVRRFCSSRCRTRAHRAKNQH